MYYQYNFNKASNIFAGMIQSESPYFQPTPKAPAPYDGVVGKLAGDPDYSCSNSSEFGGCGASWAVLMRGCRNIFVAGAGLYSWFSTYTQECSMYLPRANPLLIRASGVALTRDVLHAVDKHECQKALMLLEKQRGQRPSAAPHHHWRQVQSRCGRKGAARHRQPERRHTPQLVADHDS